VVADSIGTYQFSGVGGQMDFMRGAAISEGGKPIIALPARTAKGVARIVPFLKPGAGVVTTRAHVHYVVTEYGIAYLFGKNLRQRAKALIEISHPDDREELSRVGTDRFKIF
jgi:acyl-CoA hydrolase